MESSTLESQILEVLDRLARIEIRMDEVYATRGYVHETVDKRQAECSLVLEAEKRRSFFRGGGLPTWLAAMAALTAVAIALHSCMR